MATLTSKLGGLFRRMRVSRPANIDLHEQYGGGGAAGGDGSASAEPTALALRRLAEGESASRQEVLDRTGSVDLSPGAGEHRPGLLSRLSGGAKRDAAVAHLQRDYQEVIALVRDVRRHLDQQADRSERLLELLSGMPDALRALPETNRNQAKMLEAISTHLDRTHAQAHELNGAIRGLASATEHQSQTLGVLQEQIHASRETDEAMRDSFSAMSRTLENLNATTRQSSTAITTMSEQTAASEQRLADLVNQSNRTMMIVSAISWVAAAGAIGLAIYAALKAAG